MVSAEAEAKMLQKQMLEKEQPGGVVPTQQHVLLGRGKSHLNHMGNVVCSKPFILRVLAY